LTSSLTAISVMHLAMWLARQFSVPEHRKPNLLPGQKQPPHPDRPAPPCPQDYAPLSLSFTYSTFGPSLPWDGLHIPRHSSPFLFIRPQDARPCFGTVLKKIGHHPSSRLSYAISKRCPPFFPFSWDYIPSLCTLTCIG